MPKLHEVCDRQTLTKQLFTPSPDAESPNERVQFVTWSPSVLRSWQPAHSSSDSGSIRHASPLMGMPAFENSTRTFLPRRRDGLCLRCASSNGTPMTNYTRR